MYVLRLQPCGRAFTKNLNSFFKNSYQNKSNQNSTKIGIKNQSVHNYNQ